MLWQYSDGDPQNRASNVGSMKKSQVSTIYHFILEMIKVRAVVIIDMNRTPILKLLSGTL